MEKSFAQNAFNEIHDEQLKKEVKDFEETFNTLPARLAFEITAGLSIGPDRYKKLIKVINENDLSDAFYPYATFCRALGFKKGYEKGRMAMLNEMNN